MADGGRKIFNASCERDCISCDGSIIVYAISLDFCPCDIGSGRAVSRLMSETQRRFVYVLRSVKNPERHYVGRASDVAERLASHNAGESPHTTRHKPWRVVVLLQFLNEQRAAEFEKYLKSGSGRAFADRYFA